MCAIRGRAGGKGIYSPKQKASFAKTMMEGERNFAAVRGGGSNLLTCDRLHFLTKVIKDYNFESTNRQISSIGERGSAYSCVWRSDDGWNSCLGTSFQKTVGGVKDGKGRSAGDLVASSPASIIALRSKRNWASFVPYLFEACKQEFLRNLDFNKFETSKDNTYATIEKQL